MANTGPLNGVKVVEIDAIGPVPVAAMMLAELGCEVVRIARPPNSGQAWSEIGGAVLNRSRPVVHLDLKAPIDRDAALSLIDQADILIEGFRPGVMERLGLGPDVCLKRNPRLVFVRMTGWGQTGPLADRAGHDINYIAITGVLHAMGDPAAPPPVPLNLVGDYGGGAMFAVTGALAGVVDVRSSGKGQVVDVAMTDGVAALSAMFHGLAGAGLWTSERGGNLLDGSKPFYRCYACADGGHVAVGALEPQFFAQLLDGLGIASDRFIQYDPAGWPDMTEAFAAAFAARSRDEWAAAFEGTDACVSPVLSFEEAARHPHNQARGSYAAIDNLTQPTPAPRFSRTETAIRPMASNAFSVSDILSRWATSAATA